MNRYTKVINMMESYFTKDFEKAKKGIIIKIVKYLCNILKVADIKMRRD